MKPTQTYNFSAKCYEAETQSIEIANPFPHAVSLHVHLSQPKTIEPVHSTPLH